MNALRDPREARAFRFLEAGYHKGVVSLSWAFDDGPALVETIRFPEPPSVPQERRDAFESALNLLHLVAGVSYYKAGVPDEIQFAGESPGFSSARFAEVLYRNGLAEFAWRNGLELGERIRLPASDTTERMATRLDLPARTLVPIGGGKDSLVAIEALKAIGADATAVWIGNSPLIENCARHTGLPLCNIGRELSPLLFEYNRLGAWNGHIPVTAINSAILVVAAVLYGFDSIAFANERSASAATIEYEGGEVNHQWSKGDAFEAMFQHHVRSHVAADLTYFSLLRPFSELAVTASFARNCTSYLDVFSSCNRNFRILGPRPADRWCGQCPKCHFVFLALAPFLPKPRLVGVFGRNLLDDESQAAGFDALMEYRNHKPFECVGEAAEARAAMAALATRPEWVEDALVARFIREIRPQLDAWELALEPWLESAEAHRIPPRLVEAIDAIRGS